MRPRLLAIALVIFVLGSIALEAFDDLQPRSCAAIPPRCASCWPGCSRRSCSCWQCMRRTARGRRDGIDIGAVRMLYHLRPTRAALSDSLMHHHAHAALDARRIHAYLSGVKL
jgi:hypothetical protein